MLVHIQTKQQRVKTHYVHNSNIGSLLPTLQQTEQLDLHLTDFRPMDPRISNFVSTHKIYSLIIEPNVHIDGIFDSNVEKLVIKSYTSNCSTLHTFLSFPDIFIKKETRQIKFNDVVVSNNLDWIDLLNSISKTMVNNYSIFIFSINISLDGSYGIQNMACITSSILKIENYVERNKKGYEKCKNACIATLGIFKLHPGTIQKEVVLLIGNMIFNTGGTEVWIE